MVRYWGGGAQGDGGKILGHVFGGRQPRADQALGQASGLGGDRAGMLLKMLAPIVLAYLAKRQEQQRVGHQGGLGSGVLAAVHDQAGRWPAWPGDLFTIGGGLPGGRR